MGPNWAMQILSQMDEETMYEQVVACISTEWNACDVFSFLQRTSLASKSCNAASIAFSGPLITMCDPLKAANETSPSF